MFGLMGLFGAACILWGAGIYLRLFLRRPRYDDPLAYAQALSLCADQLDNSFHNINYRPQRKEQKKDLCK